jgi:hypothetical protein
MATPFDDEVLVDEALGWFGTKLGQDYLKEQRKLGLPEDRQQQQQQQPQARSGRLVEWNWPYTQNTLG